MQFQRQLGNLLFGAGALFALLAFSLPCVLAQTRPARGTPRKPGAALAQAAQPAGQQLPLRRIILYSNGVAYFERRGTVAGRAEINLAFKQSQVDDVLKSLVVLDLGKGRIGAVSYNSSAPPAARLKEIPFSIEAAADDDATGGLAGVLKQLQGARIAVATAQHTASGALITIGQRELPASDKADRTLKTHTLVISTEAGELQSFDLSEVRGVKLLDEGARYDLAQFANASASARRRDAKTITVTSEGDGPREMVVSYTIAAPIWKTTYRVVLDQAGKPFFQGWAVVDNVSEEDWTEVALSLVSGTPVSFIQPLQKPLYRYRPVVPIPQNLSLHPQVYEAGEIPPNAGLTMTETRYDKDGKPVSVTLGAAGSLSNLGGIGRGSFVGGGTNNQQIQNQSPISKNDSLARLSGPTTPAPRKSIEEVLASGESGVTTAAEGSEVGELFEYRVEQPITVRRDRSALIPILQTQMEGERVSIYNEAAQRDRPMNGLRLKNTSSLTLEGGALTVIDGDAYAGEALLERLKPGEQRYISFGLDLGTFITAKFKSENRPVFFARVYKGVFQTYHHQTMKKTYTIINQTDKRRIIYIEHPLRESWKLADETPPPASKTVNWYRFRVELEPRQTIELPVAEIQEETTSYLLSSLTSQEAELFFASKYIDAPLKARLEKLLGLKAGISRNTDRLAALVKEAQEIEADQTRLRENIAALKNTADAKQLIARYINKANQQETRLEQIAAEKIVVAAEGIKLQGELDAALRDLGFEQKLSP